MAVAETMLEPVIAIWGAGLSTIASLNVAVIVTASPDLYGLVAEYVIAAVGAVLSTVKVEPLVGADVIILPASSVPVESATDAVPSPVPTVWLYV